MKALKKLNHNLFKEEDFSQCLKILLQYTVKKTKVDWQRFEMFWLKGKRAIPLTNTCMITNIPAPRVFVRPGMPGPLLGYFNSRPGYFIRRCL